MTILNGTHGELRWNGLKIAKVTNAALTLNRDTLDTSGIGDMDQTYTYGRRNTSGTATLLYKTDDAATQQLMNRILSEEEESSEALTMVLRTGQTQGTVSGTALISSMGVTTSVGDNTSVNVSFVISGKPSGIF
jgi:predicted ABC-class ATPase